MSKEPTSALRFLRWICPDHLYEEIEGDLMQRFLKDVEVFGDHKAKRKFIWNTIRFFRPGIIFRNKVNFELNLFPMFQNYFKIAYRHLMKSKVFSMINVLGLSVGITAFFLILQYVSFEMSYDQFHQNKDEIFRVAYQQHENGELKSTSARNFIGIRSLLKEHFPEMKSFTGFVPIPANTGFLFRYKEKIFMETGGNLRADPNFFKVFPSLLLRGDPESVLNDRHNIVISEKIARKVFGDADPMGQRLDEVEDHGQKGPGSLITGIMRDIPENSHMHGNVVTYLDTEWDSVSNYWNSPDFYTFLSMKKESDPKSVEERLNKLLNHVKKESVEAKGASVFLQPLTDIHLRSDLKDEMESNGNLTLIYVLAGVGLIILIIAWINYVNIETARFVTRAREVSVRRIIGSRKTDLAWQFLIEFFCINVLSVAAALGLLQLILPYFGYLTGIPISSIQWLTPMVWVSASAIFVIGSFLVGIYPALFLLRLNPVAALKGNFGGPNRGGNIRKSLIVIQFTSTVIILAFLMVVYQQLDYMRVTNKKIELEKVIAVRNPTAYSTGTFDTDYADFKIFQTKLLENHAVKTVCSSSAIPGAQIGFTFVNLLKRSVGDPYDATRYKMLFVDYNFIPLYGLKLKAGRNFNSENAEDVEVWEKQVANIKVPDNYYLTLILNESAVHALGFNSADEAVNQVVKLHLWADDFENYKIIGVLEDYYHEAVKRAVNPMILTLNHNKFQQVYYSVKLNAGTNPQDALTLIKKNWDAAFPQKPFDYFFIDDYYDQQFKSELHFGRIFGLFAGVAIFIACLGILGMTLFETQLRSKEISIRKVLGATISNLIALLTKDYFKLVLLATAVAVPVIYYSSHEWLSRYPVRIEVSGWFFVLPLLVIVMLVIVASGFQTIKAARANPVDNLKYE